MKIGLIGFSFSHENKGCEALTYSMIGLLQKLFPKERMEIVNFSSVADLGDVPASFPQIHFSSYQIRLKDWKMSYMKEFQSCDMVFDITFGDGFSDIYFVKPMYKNVLIKWLAGASKTKFVLAPQTYGPFSDKKLERFAAMAIRKADYVYSRDQLSANYVKQISGREIKVVTDLAFALPFDKNAVHLEGANIGINISGLLWKGGFSSSNQFGLTVDYREYCKRLIDYLLEETDYKIHLISHVTVPADKTKVIPDSDVEGCQELKKFYAKEDRVILAPVYESPIMIKNYIVQMDYFIGARMHATIGAFSGGVKTIPFAYSRKFQGLYENLQYPYFIDGTKVSTEEALEKTIELFGKADEIVAASEIGKTMIQKNMAAFEQELMKIVTEA